MVVTDRDGRVAYALYNAQPSVIGVPRGGTTYRDDVSVGVIGRVTRDGSTVERDHRARSHAVAFPDTSAEAVDPLSEFLDSTTPLRANAAGVLGDVAKRHVDVLVPQFTFSGRCWRPTTSTRLSTRPQRSRR